MRMCRLSPGGPKTVGPQGYSSAGTTFAGRVYPAKPLGYKGLKPLRPRQGQTGRKAGTQSQGPVGLCSPAAWLPKG